MLRPNKISPKKPCPFCGAFLENEAPSTIWCHPQNGCLLSLRVLQETSRLLSGIRDTVRRLAKTMRLVRNDNGQIFRL